MEFGRIYATFVMYTLNVNGTYRQFEALHYGYTPFQRDFSPRTSRRRHPVPFYHVQFEGKKATRTAVERDEICCHSDWFVLGHHP